MLKLKFIQIYDKNFRFSIIMIISAFNYMWEHTNIFIFTFFYDDAYTCKRI